ncbi:MAG TPA: hypothetical protein VFP91_01430 [Vicinamibacterales bacterium]|nr:hypothetical protein [Vicinamibacterales bacterium]
MFKAALVTAIVLTAAHTATAQTTEKNPLAQVKHLKCRFSVYASASWSKAQEPQAQVRQPETLSLDIDEIDTDSGSGRVTGTAGPADVTALLTISSLHFMERSVTGTLNITTVFAGDPDAKTFRAVHARHDYLPMSLPGYQSEPSVSQHYGVCESTK